jgi:hypothetical protein
MEWRKEPRQIRAALISSVVLLGECVEVSLLTHKPLEGKKGADENIIKSR